MKMFFLTNKVIVPMLKNKRVFSNCNNNNCCNLDIETKKKIQLMFIMTPSLYAITLGTWVLTIISMIKK
jgi:hypothetical protein